MSRKTKELEDIFLDTIIWRVESIKKRCRKPAFDYAGLRENCDDYKESVDRLCDIVLDYIKEHDHMVKQKDNYEQLLLDRMLDDGMITTDVYYKYSPLPIDGVELLLQNNVKQP